MASRAPAAIQAFIDATNEEDSQRFIDLFAPNAQLVDWGRAYQGATEIARWNDSDNIGKRSRFTLLSAEPTHSAEEWLVVLRVTGEGFNGDSPFRFKIIGDAITSVVIEPS